LADRALDEWAMFEIANRIYKPSYVSLESALAHYQLIPEITYGVTSISTRRSYRFASSMSEFRYRTVTPRLFFGYDLAAAGARRVKIARPEKAVLDFLYLNPRLRSNADFGSLRIDAERFFQLVSEERLRTALARFRHKALLERVERFLSYCRERS
jgi:predicted transcriptional regulator of viral defense system